MFVLLIASVIVLIKRITFKQTSFDNYQNSNHFKYQKHKAKQKISSAIDSLEGATSLYGINYSLVQAHNGLEFFDAYNVKFASKTPDEVRKLLEVISVKKIKRLYEFYK